jgi:cytochrome c553
MLPEPPDLAVSVDDWTDAELFRIVKHGIRFTGMPAWPSQARDDEVWMMVAFLRALPGLDAGGYRGLVGGDRELAEPLARCAGCHGADGRGGGAHVPVLAGQSETYLRASLLAYAEGRRASGIMELAVSGLSPDALAALARHYAAAPADRSPGSAPPHGAAAELASRGRPADGLPACLACHAGNRDPHFPMIAGQRAAYLAAQLRLFREGVRGGTAYRQVMTEVARGLEEADIAALAEYFEKGTAADTADRGGR